MPSLVALDSAPTMADLLWKLSNSGRVFIASDAAQGDMVTGQTSFAATTPTFLLQVPKGKVVVPLFVNLAQSGTVAGGAVDVLIEIDNIERYSTGGTLEKSFNPRRTNNTSKSKLYSGATAFAGYGIRVWGATVGQDVSSAEGAVQGPYWKPEIPYFVEGPGALLVYTYAGVTGPTFLWSVGYAEFDQNELDVVA